MNKFLRILCLISIFFSVWTISAQADEKISCSDGIKPLYHRYLKQNDWKNKADIKCEGEVISFFKAPTSTALFSKPALRKTEISSSRFVGQYWKMIDQVDIQDAGVKNADGKEKEDDYILETFDRGKVPVGKADPMKVVCPNPNEYYQDKNDAVNPYGVDDEDPPRTPRYLQKACIESLQLLKKICKFDLDCNQTAKGALSDKLKKDFAKELKNVETLKTEYLDAKNSKVEEIKKGIPPAISLNIKSSDNISLTEWPYVSDFNNTKGVTLSSFIENKAEEEVKSKREAWVTEKKATDALIEEAKAKNKEPNKKFETTAKEITQRIAFIDNRISELNMSILIEDSSGFNVTKVLQQRDDSTEGQLKIIGGDSKRNIFDKIIRLIAQTLGTFGVLLLIVASFYMITSQGDENQLQKGKQIFTYTALGLLVAFLSYTIVQLVLDLLLW